MDLFSSVNTRTGKTVHTESVRVSQYIGTHRFLFLIHSLCENIPISPSVP